MVLADEKTVLEMVESTTRLLREQLTESEFMNRDTSDGQLFRYAFTIGGLLAFVDPEAKGPLMEMIRHGLGLEGATVPGESVDLPGTEVIPETIVRP